METQAEFAERVKPYLDSLYRTALRMTGERSSAEDLVQETFLKAYRGYARFEPGSNFKAWLFTILTNAYINDYRRRSRTPVVTDFAEVEPEGERRARTSRPRTWNGWPTGWATPPSGRSTGCRRSTGSCSCCRRSRT
jgi:RNA polymerase sigma-70 factor (ECF subfamily)